MTEQKPLKVVAFNGRYHFHLYRFSISSSCHPQGHTSKAVHVVFEELRKQGIECEMVMLYTGILWFFFKISLIFWQVNRQLDVVDVMLV